MNRATPLPDIQELTYYVHGTMMEPIRSVSLILQGEKALVRIFHELSGGICGWKQDRSVR